MRIGFDTSALVRPHPPGIVRLVASAMEALERTPGITALRLAPEKHENLRVWRQVRLPQLVRERELVGLHSFVSAYALLGPGARVQTIHELPWRHGVSENAGLAHRFWADVASRKAARIVCGSAFVAREVGSGALASRVRVCPWGVDAAHFGSTTPELRAAARAVLAADGRDGVVLALGAVRRKKNLAALLRGAALRMQRGKAPVLVAVTGIVGRETRYDQELARALGLERHVRWLGHVEEPLLVALLHEARAAAVLSRSEGFGLPVLEAFAVGRAVLVPRASAQSEVAAGLGVEVDAEDPDSVESGLESALHDGARDGERRAHAASFSWKRCAERIAEIWRELA